MFGFKWLAQSTIYRDSIDLLAVRDFGDRMEVVQPVELLVKQHERGMPIDAPTLALQPDSARSLMQALWDAGIRPSNKISNDAEVAALKGHIAFAEQVARALLPPPSQQQEDGS